MVSFETQNTYTNHHTKYFNSYSDLNVLELLWRINDGYSPSPLEIESLEQVTELNLVGANIPCLPQSIKYLKKLQSLNLMGAKVESFPSSLPLIHLQSIDLSFSNIESLPDSIRQVKNLKTLFLTATEITDLPVWLSELSSLEYLSLNATRISTMPDVIQSLDSLQTLYLNSTAIKELPPWIGKLSALKKLYLSNTQITSLNESLRRLHGLKLLDLHKSRISALPDWEWRESFPDLEYLDLSFLTIKRIPEKLSLMGLPFIDEEQMKPLENIGINLHETTLVEQNAYVFIDTPELIQQLYIDQVSCPECKVTVLGNGGVGKSYTIQRIRENGRKESLDHKISTSMTPGVEIKDYHISYNKKQYNIYFWDFGGQDVLHSLHRCFLTEQTYYVIVVSSRETNGDRNARYWLRNVTTFAPNAPILLFINCWDNDEGCRTLNAQSLKEEFPKIIDVVYCSAKESSEEDFKNKLMLPLIKSLVDTRLINQTINLNWQLVREDINKANKKYLTKSEYLNLCEIRGIKYDTANDLRIILNNLGTCFSINPREDLLTDTDFRLLNPKWLSNALYAIIEEGIIHAQNGRINRRTIERILAKTKPEQFERKEINRVLPEVTYDPDECGYIIEIAKQFCLCYQIDDETLFFPALCSANSIPSIGDEFAANFHHICYQFRYSYLPDSVIHRFMIQCYKMGVFIHSCWLNGVMVLSTDIHKAIIRAMENDILMIDIYSKPGYPPWDFFALLRSLVIEVHTSLKINAEEYVVEGKDAFSTIQLVKAQKSGQEEIYGSYSGNTYLVLDLLEQFFDAWTISELDIIEGQLRTIPYKYHQQEKNDKVFRRALWESYGKRCKYCNMYLMMKELQVDHIIASKYLPRKDGHLEMYLTQLKEKGFNLEKPDYIENYFPTCSDCNRVKSNKTRDTVSLREYHAIALNHTPMVLRRMRELKDEIPISISDTT